MTREGPPSDWPHAKSSAMIACPPHRWHVQDMGAGETLLLLHGAGGGTQSMRHLMQRLAPSHRVIALDLPGQGYTRPGRRDRFGLDGMAEDIATLSVRQGWTPVAVIGHSAGGALALRLAEILPLRAVVGINAALGTFEGMAGVLFPMMAKALTLTPFVAQVFAKMTATSERVQALLASTGSAVTPEMVDLYRRQIARPEHVEGTLAMMAQWRLEELLERLPYIAVPTLLLTGARDRTVPPAVSARAAAAMPQAVHEDMPDLGHLMHEEAPEAVAGRILAFLAAQRAG
jgi:magnesium chelatase accessory protein